MPLQSNSWTGEGGSENKISCKMSILDFCLARHKNLKSFSLLRNSLTCTRRTLQKKPQMSITFWAKKITQETSNKIWSIMSCRCQLEHNLMKKNPSTNGCTQILSYFFPRHKCFCNRLSILSHISIGLFAVDANFWRKNVHWLPTSKFHYALWKGIASLSADHGILALILPINPWHWSWCRIVGDQTTFRTLSPSCFEIVVTGVYGIQIIPCLCP